MRTHYFLFFILNVAITCWVIFTGEISLGALFVFSVYLLHFFFYNAYRAEKTKYSIISFYLYLIFFICAYVFIVIGITRVPDHPFVSEPDEIPLSDVEKLLLFFCAITFILSYSIVIIQIIRKFSSAMHSYFIKRKLSK